MQSGTEIQFSEKRAANQDFGAADTIFSTASQI